MILSELLAPYGEPQRGYHNFQHITEMLAHLETYRSLRRQPGLLTLAILFHDVVYDTSQTGGANERASADVALTYMQAQGYGLRDQSYVHELIMDTTHTARAETSDGRLMQDFDLLSFALAPDFKVTAYGIRREYRHLTELEFWTGRLTVLEWFLDRPALYHTPMIHDQYESRARKNIEAELRWVEQHIEGEFT